MSILSFQAEKKTIDEKEIKKKKSLELPRVLLCVFVKVVKAPTPPPTGIVF